MNWKVSIMGLNIFPRYIEGRVSDAIRGIDYAIDKKAHIINASWGAGPGDITEDEFRSLREAIERAEQAGILFVAAAGNSGKSNETKGDIPASFDLKNIISVGSFNRKTKASDFSNFGSTSVDIFAPGEEIYSTLPKGRYGYKSGTSMAAPMIAGIAALTMARDLSVSGLDIKELLLDSCVEAPKLATLSRCQGAISAEKAITNLEASIQ